MLFAQGRKTVASWLRGGGFGCDYKAYYYFLGSLGRKAQFVSSLLLRLAVDVIAPGERLLFALDDTPTQRYGARVEGAGIHHNPTPGPVLVEQLRERRTAGDELDVTLSVDRRRMASDALVLAQIDGQNGVGGGGGFRCRHHHASSVGRWLLGW